MSAIRDGYYFEELVDECFKASGMIVDTRFTLEDCRPDFVIHEQEHWADAKLSKSTVFAAETIEKYTKHADHLTIIYALDDIPDEEVPFLDDNVTLVHVLDYFEDLPEELSTKVLDFIEGVWEKRDKVRMSKK